MCRTAMCNEAKELTNKLDDDDNYNTVGKNVSSFGLSQGSTSAATVSVALLSGRLVGGGTTKALVELEVARGLASCLTAS